MAPEWDDHFLLAWGGSFYTTEQWSCSLRFSKGGLTMPGPTQNDRIAFAADKLDEVATKVKAYHTGPHGLSHQAWLSYVKFNAINTAGHYASAVSNTYDVTPRGVPTGFMTPGGQAPALPPQLALAVSLRTGLRSGRGAFGRVFLPPQVLTLESEAPYITAAATGAIATHFADFINSLNNWSGLDLGQGPRVSILSRERIPDPDDDTPLPHADPETTPVTEIRVGNIYDTITRRRNQLREVYAIEALD